MNILASTSRQWNCGDEFILFGIQRLLSSVIAESINWSIFNRNPDILGRVNVWSNGAKCETLDPYELIIIAGTPEWRGLPLKPLFDRMSDEKRTALFLGIGAADESLDFTAVDRAALSASPLVVCRDVNAQREATKGGAKAAHLMPCPAIFAGEPTRQRTKLCRVAVVNQVARTINQCVSTELSAATNRVYEGLRAKGYAADLLCHYVDEFHVAAAKGYSVRYSYDARDYLRFYDDYDAVVTTRLHGAVIAVSLGIPTLLVNRDSRCAGAAAQIPLLVSCSPAEAIERLEQLDLAVVSSALADFRFTAFKAYRALISKTSGTDRDCFKTRFGTK